MIKNITYVTIGDIEGIGIKLLIKLWKDKKINNFVLITNFRLFKNYINKNKIKLKISIYNNKISKNNFLIHDIKAKNNIENTYNSLLESYNLSKNINFKGVINLPINKEKIIKKIDNKFIGQTEFYQKLEKQNYSNMLFYSKDIIFSTLTTHIPIHEVRNFIKNEKLISIKIKNLIKTLIFDFKINNPKIAILGLNPHAGENGLIGKEDLKIKKIINKINLNKKIIDGPISADGIFYKRYIKKYDCFISAYHDQALIPFKIISKFVGLNYTDSLKFYRVSPIHGTGYNLVKKNYADDKSLLFCFKFINKISKNKIKN